MILATVDLVRTDTNGSVWHIVALPDRDTAVCSWAIPESALREEGLDAHVVSYRGVHVCSRCLKGLR